MKFTNYLAIVPLLFLINLPGLHGAQSEPTQLSSYGRQIVATCLILEAASEGEEGMRAVLNVIYNRSNHDLRKVVRATVRKGQFTAMQSIWGQAKPDYGPLIRRAQWDRNYPIAMGLILQMERGQLEDNTNGATHYFHGDYKTPYWAKKMQHLVTIGVHEFYAHEAKNT